MKKRKVKKTTLIISLLVFILALLLIVLYFTFHDVKEHQPIKEKEVKEKTENKDTKLDEIKKLYEENSDLIGWLQIKDTKINYPVMYTKGEDYYLYKDFYKKKYNPGSLFVDKHNNVDPRDTNLIIHGHNMDDGSMFHDLEKYLKEDFYKKHKTFKFYSLTSEDEYEIVSVFKSKVYNVDDKVFKYYKFYNAKNKEEYDNYIKNIKKLELYKTGVSASYNEELITLSTCEYSQENGRLVVVAKKIS